MTVLTAKCRIPPEFSQIHHSRPSRLDPAQVTLIFAGRISAARGKRTAPAAGSRTTVWARATASSALPVTKSSHSDLSSQVSADSSPAAKITMKFLARRVTSASVRGVPRHACDASGLAPQADRKMYDTSGGAGPAVLLETPEIKRLVLRLARRVHCGVIAGSRASC
jgi:hypothetical protein